MNRIKFSPVGAQLWSKFPATHPVRLEGDGLATIRLRPELDSNEISIRSLPLEVFVGIYAGFSLPIWATPAHQYEQLFYKENVPRRWDGASDFIASVVAVLDTANTDQKFQLQLAWEHFAKGGVVPTSSNLVTCEKDTGTAAQYQSFVCDFTIDFNIDGVGNEIKNGEVLTARLRRVAASTAEIAGEVIIIDWYVEYRRNKLGAQVV